jgi:hypothetical protein
MAKHRSRSRRKTPQCAAANNAETPHPEARAAEPAPPEQLLGHTRYTPYPKDDPGKDPERLASEQAIREEGRAARQAGPARQPPSVASVQTACDHARLSLQLLGRLSRREKYDSDDARLSLPLLGRLSRKEKYGSNDHEPDYRRDFIEPILELWRRVLPRDCPPPLLPDTQPNIEAARSALDLLQAELVRLGERQARLAGPATEPVPSRSDGRTITAPAPPQHGPASLTDDSETYVLVSELWPARREFKRPSDVTKFLHKLPNEPFPTGIRNRREGQRRKVHLGDWHRHFTQKDRRTNEALGDESLQERIADIVAKTEQERQQKRRK